MPTFVATLVAYVVIAPCSHMLAGFAASIAVAVFVIVSTCHTANVAIAFPTMVFVEAFVATLVTCVVSAPSIEMLTEFAAYVAGAIFVGVSAVLTTHAAVSFPIMVFVPAFLAALSADAFVPPRVFACHATLGAHMVITPRTHMLAGLTAFVAVSIFVRVLASLAALSANTVVPPGVIACHATLGTHVVITPCSHMIAGFAATIAVAVFVIVPTCHTANVAIALPTMVFVEAFVATLVAYAVIAPSAIVPAVLRTNVTPAITAVGVVLIVVLAYFAAKVANALLEFVITRHTANYTQAVGKFMIAICEAMDTHALIPFMIANGRAAIAAILAVSISFMGTGSAAIHTPIVFEIVLASLAAHGTYAALILVITRLATFIAYTVIAPSIMVATLIADVTLTKLEEMYVIVFAGLTASDARAIIKNVITFYVAILADAFLPIMEACRRSALVTKFTRRASFMFTECMANMAEAVFVIVLAFFAALQAQTLIIVSMLTCRSALITDSVSPGMRVALRTAFIANAIGIRLVDTRLIANVAAAVLIIVGTRYTTLFAYAFNPRMETGYRTAKAAHFTVVISIVRTRHSANTAPVIVVLVRTHFVADVTLTAYVLVLAYASALGADSLSVPRMLAHSLALGADSVSIVVITHDFADMTPAVLIVIVCTYRTTGVADAFIPPRVVTCHAALVAHALGIVMMTRHFADMTPTALIVIVCTYRAAGIADTFVPPGVIACHTTIRAHAVCKRVITIFSADMTPTVLIVIVGTYHAAGVANALVPPGVSAYHMAFVAYAIGIGLVLTALVADMAPAVVIIFVGARDGAVNTSAVVIFVAVAFLIVGIFSMTASRAYEIAESVLLTGFFLTDFLAVLAEEGFVSVIIALIVGKDNGTNTALIHLYAIGICPLRPTKQHRAVQRVIFVALEGLLSNTVRHLPCRE